MPFRSGSVSYARFKTIGPAPKAATQEVLDALADNVISEAALLAVETQFGWTTGVHLYDTNFDRDTVVVGPCLLLAMRLDTNKVPSEIKRAYRAMAESARAQDSETGFISRREKREVAEEVEERCRQDLSNGTHRRSKLLPVCWDLERGIVYAPAFGEASSSALMDLFNATFDCRLEPLSAGSVALDLLAAKGMMRNYEDLKPSPFTKPPAGAVDDEAGDFESTPEVPWSSAGPQPSDFLGNEFLIWLWHQCEVNEGLIDTEAGRIAIVLDRLLDMDCAWEATGKQSLSATGPTRLPEAAAALLHGKWPRKAGMILALGADEYELTFQADRFQVTSLKLPKLDPPAETPQDELEHRVEVISDVDRALVGLFRVFLETRIADGWPTTRSKVSAWIRGKAESKRRAPVA
jgi:recombination associated protein RdgC